MLSVNYDAGNVSNRNKPSNFLSLDRNYGKRGSTHSLSANTHSSKSMQEEGSHDLFYESSASSESSDSSGQLYKYLRQKALKLEEQENDRKSGDVKEGNYDEHVRESNGAVIEKFIQTAEGAAMQKPSVLLTVFGMQSRMIMGDEDGQIYEIYEPEKHPKQPSLEEESSDSSELDFYKAKLSPLTLDRRKSYHTSTSTNKLKGDFK